MQTLIDFISVSRNWKFLRNETFTKKLCCSKRVYLQSDCWKKTNFFEGFNLRRKLLVLRRCFEGKAMIGWLKIQKHPSVGALLKGCSQNMQQIYRRTSMSKCDFSKVAKQLYRNHAFTWVFPCKFVAYFQSTFPKNTSGGLLLEIG